MKMKMKMRLEVGMLLLALCLNGCSGVRQSGNVIHTHAEAIKVFGYSIPNDDQQKALELLPAGATITNLESTPADWTSLLGVLGNLLWVDITQVSAELPRK